MKIRLLFVIATLVIPAFAQRGEYAVPIGADLIRFPIMPAPLTVSQQAELGLSVKKLTESTVVENHHRNLGDKKGRFVKETLNTGTLVFVDKSDKIRYKVDCGNRLVEESKYIPKVTSAFIPISSGDPIGSSSGVSGDSKGKKLPGQNAGTSNGSAGSGSRFNLVDNFSDLLKAIVFLAFMLLGIALLALLGILLWRLIERFNNRVRPAVVPVVTQPVSPQTPITPAPVVTDPPASTQTSVSRSENTNHRRRFIPLDRHEGVNVRGVEFHPEDGHFSVHYGSE